MRIAITGAAGMLGLDVAAAASAGGHTVLAMPRVELDITDAGAVQHAFDAVGPELVINCAAYTKVDAAEKDEPAALAINGAGAGHVAAAAAEVGAWVVHVSTDYVFDGTKGAAPYVESDPTGPRSAYGRTKLAGEQAVAREAPDAHTIVRSSWLFGTGGPCFPKTMLRLAAERDRLTVVDDQIGSPTFTGHLAPALIELGAGRVLGVTHVAGAGSCSWFAFARAIIQHDGLSCDVAPCTTAEYPLPAPRPAFSVLASERGALVPTLPAWESGLDEFMAARQSAGR